MAKAPNSTTMPSERYVALDYCDSLPERTGVRRSARPRTNGVDLSDDLLDYEVLEDLGRLETARPGAMRRLFSAFTESVDECLSRLRGAQEAGDHAGVGDQVHRLCGLSAQFGASALAGACRTLLLMPHTRRGSQIFEELEALSAASVNALDRFLPR